MRALVLLVVVLAGCDPEGVTTMEQTPSLPPPVEIAPGTLVVQTWQFRNACPGGQIAHVNSNDGQHLASIAVPAHETFFADARCAVGDEVCATVARPHGESPLECKPCAPGIRPVTVLPCP